MADQRLLNIAARIRTRYPAPSLLQTVPEFLVNEAMNALADAIDAEAEND